MNTAESARRDFLKRSLSTAGAAWMSLQWPAVLAAASAARDAFAAGATFKNLTADEARDLDAIAAQIIPTDDSPGAREAGVVYFIDAALGSFAAARAGGLRAGLADLNAKARAVDPAASGFAALSGDAQGALLTQEHSGEFFQAIRFLTVCGMFALPSYGGNRDEVGWKLLGFDHRHVWAPPFGYYDAQAAIGDKT
jgi:gluconate 2-dehydrogenase gamma chain